MFNNDGEKIHYKMYKSGKSWIFGAITVSMFSAGIFGGTFLSNGKNVHADTLTTTSTSGKESTDDNIQATEIKNTAATSSTSENVVLTPSNNKQNNDTSSNTAQIKQTADAVSADNNQKTSDVVVSSNSPTQKKATPIQTQKNVQYSSDSNGKETYNRIQNDNQVSLFDNHEDTQSTNSLDSKETNTNETDKNSTYNLNDITDISDQFSKDNNKVKDSISTANPNNDNSVPAQFINNNVSNVVLATNSNNEVHTGTMDNGATYSFNSNNGQLEILNGNMDAIVYDSKLQLIAKDILSIKIDPNVTASIPTLFGYLTNLTEITGFKNLSISGNMSGMFYGDTSLVNLNDINDLDTSKVTSMNNLFYKDSLLVSLDLSNWNTSNVTSMSSMFYTNSLIGATNSKLTSIKQNFDTTNVTDMSLMFCDDGNLINLDVSNFNTANVTSMKWMFDEAKSLKQINVSNWDTSKVVTMEWMFINSGVEELDFTNWTITPNTKTAMMLQTDYGNFEPIRIIKIGKNVHFNTTDDSYDPVLRDPGDPSKCWQAVGSGTIDNPNGKKIPRNPYAGNDPIYQMTPGTWVWGNINDDNKESITGKDVTIYAGDQLNNADFDASATDKAGNSEAVTIDTSKVDVNKPGVYTVTITTADGQSKTVTVTVLANKESITGKDVTIYAGDQLNNADFDASATDKAGNSEAVTIDTSKVDVNKPGVYTVTITTADGQSKTVTVTVLANKESITGKDVTIYAGDQLNNADFDASATDKAGNSEAVTIDTSKVDVNKPGVYTVTITTADGQSKTVTVTVLANKESITGKDVTIYAGDQLNNADFDASATDKAGNSEAVTIDTSKVDVNKPGVYTVTITTADGQSKTVTVTVLANKESITGKDVTIYAGDQLNNADFDASATDKAGNSEAVTIDTSKVDVNKPGVYTVTITTADGQSKTVTVTVLANKGQAQINVNPSETLSTGNDWKPIDSIKSIIDENGNNINVQNALNNGSLKTTLTSLNNNKNDVKFISFARVNDDGTSSIVTLDDIHNVKGTYICTYLFEGQLAQTTLFVGTNDTDSMANSIIFEDPQGNVVSSPFVITGKPGDTENITSHIPSGYHLVNDNDKIITLSGTKETFIILVEKDSNIPSNNGGNIPNNNVPGNNIPSNHSSDTSTNGKYSENSTTNKSIIDGTTENDNSSTKKVSGQVNNKIKTNQNSENNLPQTGEESKVSSLLSIVGAILLSILGLCGFRKNKY